MLTSRNIDDLRPDVAAAVRLGLDRCAAAGLDVCVTCTVRDDEYQAYLYAQGRTRPGGVVTHAKKPSFHSVKAGLAFDFCENVKGREYDRPEFFREVAAVFEAMGFEWGGRWKAIADTPHLQWSGYKHEYTSADILAGRYPPELVIKGDEPVNGGTYKKVNGGLHIVRMPVRNFRLLYWDRPKKTTTVKNYANAGFFGGFKGAQGDFTLPAANFIGDYDATVLYADALAALSALGRLDDGKVYVDCRSAYPPFKGREVSTLVVDKYSGKAGIKRLMAVNDGMSYAISGLPVMAGGADVSWSREVVAEGWDDGPTRPTWHGLLCVTAAGDEIIYVALETKSGNCVQSSEAYYALKGLGLGITDAIMIDGGGSFVLDHGGVNVAATSENRRVNSLLLYGGAEVQPEPEPGDDARAAIDKAVRRGLVSGDANAALDGPLTLREYLVLQDKLGLLD